MEKMDLVSKYKEQLYLYLRNDLNEEASRMHNRHITRNTRDSNKDKIVISCFERKMKSLGVTPNTREIIEAAKHDDDAVFYTVMGFKNSLLQLPYGQFKAVTHVIDNKYQYIGRTIDCKEIEEFSDFISVIPLENKEGEIAGIGKNSICVEDTEGHKQFFWYLPPPLRYNNTAAHGGTIAIYLIEKYGE